MSVSDEDKLLASLIWSTKTFSLAEFVEKYELPQVVCVETGYFGDSEQTTLSSGQVLTLHSLQSTGKFVCETPFDGIITIPQNCSFKFRIHPKDCEHTSVTANQLATRYLNTKYIQVVHLNHPDVNESFDVDDILKIKHFDSAKSLIKCSDVSTGSNVSIAFKCDALFSPLLDQREYTLAEVKRCFGFPAEVCLSKKKTEGKSRSMNDSSMLVSNLREIKVYDEIEDYVVISTTMCGTMHNKTCMYIPKDLEIQVVVAEGFISGDAAYQKIVRTLDKRLNRTCLKDFQDLDVYQHMDAVKKAAGVSTFSVEHASARIEHLVNEYRANQFPSEPSPILPPRPPRKPAASSSVQDPTLHLQAPPKIPPRPPARGSQTSRSKMVNKPKSWSLTSFKSLHFPHFPTKNQTKSDGDDSEYVEATSELPAMHIYETTGDDDSEVDKDYESVDNIYHRPVEPDYPVKPDLPSSPPPGGCCMGKEEIYQAIARIPKDLSGLTTGDVGRLLTYLGMECYVSTFDHEMVDGVMLADMNQESLESLDLGAFHIKKLLRFIEGWRPNM